MKNLHFGNTQILGGFWSHYDQLNRTVTIGNIYERFRETGRFDALKCDWKPGQPNKPHIFWDSDVAKWIEAVAYLTETHREPAWEALVDEMVENIAVNQKPSGYFNSYYITVEPDVEFQVRSNHELYCAGHLIEAAIAYDRATGKSRLLQVMQKYVDYIHQVFVVEQRASFVTPGHEEIELALLRLADYTGEQRYRDLAAFFLNERGKHKKDEDPSVDPEMWQSDVPIRQITEAKGHAVRAGYLYTAMTALARQTEDAALLDVCNGIFRNIVDHKLSITGGVGATSRGEAFGAAYVLPNTTSYNETCASIALAMFAGELQQTRIDRIYGDVIEQIAYNNLLSGLSLSGDAFFYENALEIDLQDYDYVQKLGEESAAKLHQMGLLAPRRLQRAKVFSCSCCPPNVSRILASIAQYAYTVEGSTIYCNQFMSARTELTIQGQPACIEQKTNYPCDGRISFTYRGAPATLAVRIPAWCEEYDGVTENGYAIFPVVDSQTVTVELPMEIHFVEANPKVHAAAGRCAVMRGPIVYCMESVDNGENLWDIALLVNGTTVLTETKDLPVPVITMQAQRRCAMDRLYRQRSSERIPITATLIPYFAFANRGITNMQIWTQVL